MTTPQNKAIFLNLSRKIDLPEGFLKSSLIDNYLIVVAGSVHLLPSTLAMRAERTPRRICTLAPEDSLRMFCQRQGIDASVSFYVTDLHDPLTKALDAGFSGLYVMEGQGEGRGQESSDNVPAFHSPGDALAWILRDPDPLGCLKKEIALGAERLRKGGVVAFPTETVYGLGADALNPDAVKQIFTLKGRPHFNPLIAHVASPGQLEALVTRVPETAQKLIDRFWPGPLTLVFPKKSHVPDITTGGNPTVAVRMPRHPVALELLRQANTPVAAPSANAFGKTSPTCAAHVMEQLGTGDYTLIDGGGCRVGLESTVVSVTGETPVLLRPGGITREEIESVVGPIEVLASENHPVLKNAPLQSPGLLASHYAPDTPLYIKEGLTGQNDDPQIGLILAAPDSHISKGPVVVLSESGSLEEAAARLYAALRKLDKMGLKAIWAPRFPDTGVGHALNDRLSKAAYKIE